MLSSMVTKVGGADVVAGGKHITPYVTSAFFSKAAHVMVYVGSYVGWMVALVSVVDVLCVFHLPTNDYFQLVFIISGGCLLSL